MAGSKASVCFLILGICFKENLAKEFGEGLGVCLLACLLEEGFSHSLGWSETPFTSEDGTLPPDPISTSRVLSCAPPHLVL